MTSSLYAQLEKRLAGLEDANVPKGMMPAIRETPLSHTAADLDDLAEVWAVHLPRKHQPAGPCVKHMLLALLSFQHLQPLAVHHHCTYSAEVS